MVVVGWRTKTRVKMSQGPELCFHQGREYEEEKGVHGKIPATTLQMCGLGACGQPGTCPWAAGHLGLSRHRGVQQREVSGEGEVAGECGEDRGTRARLWEAPTLREDQALAKENESKWPVSLPAPSWL